VKTYDTQKLRNIALVGSKGVGKTSLVEAALFTSGATGRMGRVDEGNSVVDSDGIEVERKQSISSKLIPIEWNAHKINMLDTPGYADFIGDVYGAMNIADVTVLVVDSLSGVEIPLKKTYNYLKDKNKPRVFYLNKMDADRSNFDQSISSINDVLESSAVLFQMPIGNTGSFRGVVDLLTMKAYVTDGGTLNTVDVPADMVEQANEKRMALMESIAETDESLLEKYLEVGELSEDDIKVGTVNGLASGQLVPIFIGSAYHNIGVNVLLDLICSHFPCPSDMPPFIAKRDDDSDAHLVVDSQGPFVAQVFKATSDPGIGDVFFFKVLSGQVNSGDDVYNINQKAVERMGHLIVFRGKERLEMTTANAGDITSIAKLKNTHLSNVFCKKSDHFHLEPIDFPIPVVPMAVIPKTKKDQDKLGIGLSKLTEIDPTFTYHVDKEFSETIVTGMGDVQIDVMIKRLLDRYNVDVELGKPHIPYREKVTKKAEKQGKHKKQSGGHGQYGDCWLKLEPEDAGEGFEFINKIVGGSIPSKYIPAVEKGVREAMHSGILAGYPVVDLKVTVYDGSYHDVDSSDMSFQIAGKLAFKNAMQAAAPQLLEPVVDLEVYAPQECMGDISSDVSQRRGRVSGMDAGILHAKVPMAELYQYSASIKSITSGSGSYSMVFSHYEPVPSNISSKIIEEKAKERESKKN